MPTAKKGKVSKQINDNIQHRLWRVAYNYTHIQVPFCSLLKPNWKRGYDDSETQTLWTCIFNLWLDTWPILFLCHTVSTSNLSLVSPWILMVEVCFVCIDQESWNYTCSIYATTKYSPTSLGLNSCYDFEENQTNIA